MGKIEQSVLYKWWDTLADTYGPCPYKAPKEFWNLPFTDSPELESFLISLNDRVYQEQAAVVAIEMMYPVAMQTDPHIKTYQYITIQSKQYPENRRAIPRVAPKPPDGKPFNQDIAVNNAYIAMLNAYNLLMEPGMHVSLYYSKRAVIFAMKAIFNFAFGDLEGYDKNSIITEFMGVWLRLVYCKLTNSTLYEMDNPGE